MEKKTFDLGRRLLLERDSRGGVRGSSCRLARRPGHPVYPVFAPLIRAGTAVLALQARLAIPPVPCNELLAPVAHGPTRPHKVREELNLPAQSQVKVEMGWRLGAVAAATLAGVAVRLARADFCSIDGDFIADGESGPQYFVEAHQLSQSVVTFTCAESSYFNGHCGWSSAR